MYDGPIGLAPGIMKTRRSVNFGVQKTLLTLIDTNPLPDILEQDYHTAIYALYPLLSPLIASSA